MGDLGYEFQTVCQKKQKNWEYYFKYKTPLDSAPHNVGWNRQHPLQLRLSDAAQIEMMCVVYCWWGIRAVLDNPALSCGV